MTILTSISSSIIARTSRLRRPRPVSLSSPSSSSLLASSTLLLSVSSNLSFSTLQHRPSSTLSSFQPFHHHNYNLRYHLCNHQKQQQRRTMITSKSAAKRLLGLTTDTFTVQELRHAYFKMAKSTHPDMKKQFDDVDTVDDEAGAKAFLDVTRAYELLLGSDSVQNDNYCIPIEEEEEYRRACQLILGIDATIVEESKTNSMFLHWLMGNTDGAQHWRSFFAVHGGLAQKLRPPAGYIGQGGGDESSSPSRSKPRRQRPPRR